MFPSETSVFQEDASTYVHGKQVAQRGNPKAYRGENHQNLGRAVWGGKVADRGSMGGLKREVHMRGVRGNEGRGLLD